MLYHKTIPPNIHGCLCAVQAVCKGEITYDLAERKRKEDIMGKKKQMRSEVKGNVKNSIGRIVFAALAVLLQIGQYYNDPGHLKCGIGMFSIYPECHHQRKQTGQQRDH